MSHEADAQKGDSYIRAEQEQAKHTANESEKTSGATGQEGPDANDQNASYTTHSERLECTGEGRGRFRDLDKHASWREVYAAMGVSVR